MTLTDRFNRSFDCIRPFLAVNRDPRDSQVLLGRLALKDFDIVIRNGLDSWEFKRIPKVKKISVAQFQRELLKAKATAFQVKIDFKPYNDDYEEEPWDNEADENIDLSKVPRRLRQRYRDFFVTAETTRRPITHPRVQHAIELKPGAEPP